MLKCELLIVCLAVQIFWINAACPGIISRQNWGALAPKEPPQRNREHLGLAVIHHSDGAACSSKDSCKRRLRSFQNSHMNEGGWKDIAYNFLISSSGDIYEGRGWGVQGSHATNFNDKSLGVCIIGNYQRNIPTQAAMKALRDLLDCAVSKDYLSSDYKIIGHRQAKPATQCPGDVLYRELKKSPKWVERP